jgi:ATP-dependent DNA helicase RecG
MDIKKMIKLPESQTLEFKRDASSLESILKSIIAFANSAGGITLIGIEDDGSITGLSDAGKTQEQIANSIAHRIRPQLLPNFSIETIKNKSILAIQVDHLPAPYYLADKGEEKSVYIRLGNSNRLASHEMIAEMKRANHHPFFDKTPCDHVTETDLDSTLIQIAFAKYPFDIDTIKLISLGVLTRKGKRIVATNGGVILFGKPMIRLQYFPFAEVRCARFKGTTKAEFIDQLNIQGSILQAIEEVPKFIRRNTKMSSEFTGAMTRKDIPEYPTAGIREALINALVHANYEILGTRILIAIYDDRLEIQNPGIMPPGMSIEQFKAGVSRIRNPVIARVFSELGLIEEWGSGYKRIQAACQKDHYPEPKWEEMGTVLRVTFFPYGTKLGLSRDQVGTKPEPSLKHSANPDLTPDEKTILNLCQTPQTTTELMKAMSWKNRTKFRNKFLIPLLEKGLLKMSIPEKPKSSKQKYQTTQVLTPPST